MKISITKPLQAVLQV